MSPAAIWPGKFLEPRAAGSWSGLQKYLEGEGHGIGLFRAGTGARGRGGGFPGPSSKSIHGVSTILATACLTHGHWGAASAGQGSSWPNVGGSGDLTIGDRGRKGKAPLGRRELAG